jgi:hypothetical protein
LASAVEIDSAKNFYIIYGVGIRGGFSLWLGMALSFWGWSSSTCMRESGTRDCTALVSILRLPAHERAGTSQRDVPAFVDKSALQELVGAEQGWA